MLAISKNKFFIAFVLFAFIFSGCKFGLTDTFFIRKNNIKHRFLTFKKIDLTEENITRMQSSEKYSILVFNDVHFGHDSENFEKLFTWLDEYLADANNLKPAFCVVNGDVAETGEKAQYEEFLKFTNKIEAYDIPVLTTLGNHDLFNDGVVNYLTMIKPYTSSFYFGTEKSAFYFIDTGNGTLGSDQYSELKKLMQNDSRKKILFSHYPFFSDGQSLFTITNSKERINIIDLCATTDVNYLITAHYHPGGYHDYGNFKEYTLADFNRTFQRAIITIDETASDSKMNVRILN